MERIRRFFRKLGKTIGKKGYTLLEVAAVVAVTGTLAAVAMPVVADKIAAGKILGAQQDVQAIKDSIVAFMKDTGVPPFYAIGQNKGSLPKTSAIPNFFIVTKDGSVPSFGTPVNTAWGIPDPATATEATIDGQLITNAPNYLTDGTNAWKGPYVPSLKKDPWGNKYVVVVGWLGEPELQDSTQIYQKAAFVISAGPNGLIETSYTQPIRVIKGTQVATPFVVGNDDIVSRIN